MFSIWSGHQKKVVRLGITHRPSSIQHNCQEQWQGRRLQTPPSLRWSHRLSQLNRILMKPQFHMGLAVNIQLRHPASMISTCRPTPSICWLLWLWFEQTKSTAPNDQSQFLRPQWMWVPLKARRQRTQQRMMLHFILRMSPDESIGIFLPAKLLSPMRRDMHLSFRALPAHRRVQEDKTGSWA